MFLFQVFNSLPASDYFKNYHSRLLLNTVHTLRHLMVDDHSPQ